jgi:hypothetical protein
LAWPGQGWAWPAQGQAMVGGQAPLRWGWGCGSLQASRLPLRPPHVDNLRFFIFLFFIMLISVDKLLVLLVLFIYLFLMLISMDNLLVLLVNYVWLKFFIF